MDTDETFQGDRTPSIKVTWAKLELIFLKLLIFMPNNLTCPNPEKNVNCSIENMLDLDSKEIVLITPFLFGS